MDRDYDAGLLNDYGGGDVEWWQDYIRAEIGRANDHWREQSADMAARIAELEAERARLRGLLWYGYHEMNAIRAESGVPYDRYGGTKGISKEYWDRVVEAMYAELGDDAKPWASKDARAALAASEGAET